MLFRSRHVLLPVHTITFQMLIAAANPPGHCSRNANKGEARSLLTPCIQIFKPILAHLVPAVHADYTDVSGGRLQARLPIHCSSIRSASSAAI